MSNFTFNISLSVLNHLGRNLYRSFITVLGEAISNAWDAEADNVWIYLDRKENYLVIKDDGNGMNGDDFQNKFLKIGYSKRKDGDVKTPNKKRPFIGRKGIGKLALLSCAEKISIITKTETTDYIGGTIDNSGLDQAIDDDLTPQEYPLEATNDPWFENFREGHEKGTIIYFDNIENGIKNTEEYLKKVIALYFRFSLVDSEFNIFFNDEQITIENLSSLADNTQFLWKINTTSDPFITQKILPNQHLKNSKTVDSAIILSGFIASVKKPRDLKILTTKEKISLDLFVNGRLREKDILKHIPTARIAENYIYGQLHCDYLDDEKDRFTSSREGIVSDDDKFQSLLDELKTILATVIDNWDEWRVEINQDGDSENTTRITKKQRKSRELFNTISDDFIPPTDSPAYDKIEDWVKKLGTDAQFNFTSYGECFISENLLRNYIKDQEIELSPESIREIENFQRKEEQNKNTANLSIEIRQNNEELSYLSMDGLANLVDKVDPTREAGLSRDAKEYKPIRDAMAHTALLTNLAKLRLNSTFENLKARLKNLLNN